MIDIKKLPLALRVEVLEELVQVLARGLLQHEYSKDLCRHATEEVCRLLANDADPLGAIVALAQYTSNHEDGDTDIERLADTVRSYQ